VVFVRSPFFLALVAPPSSLGDGAASPRLFRSSTSSFGSILGRVSTPRLWWPPARCCAHDGVIRFIDGCRALGHVAIYSPMVGRRRLAWIGAGGHLLRTESWRTMEPSSMKEGVMARAWLQRQGSSSTHWSEWLSCGAAAPYPSYWCG
jgi:hypothetical protein